MILATCRASILRAASTSSSWAAQKRVFGGVYGKKCGPRMKEQRENIQTLELRVHILYMMLSTIYDLSITLNTERCKDTQNENVNFRCRMKKINKFT